MGLSAYPLSRIATLLTVSAVTVASLVALALPASAATGLDPIGAGNTDNKAGVKCIQDALHVGRYPTLGSTDLGYGIYGPATEKAVTAFQKEQGIEPVTGVVGPKTGDALVRQRSMPAGCSEHIPTTSPVFGGKAPEHPPAPPAPTVSDDPLDGLSVGPMEKRKTLNTPDKSGVATCAVAARLEAIACSVEDRRANQSGVYVEWEAVAGQGDKLSDKNKGSRSDTPSRKRWGNLAIAVDGSVLRWKVCSKVPVFGDECSSWENISMAPGGLEVELYCSKDSPSSRTATCATLTHPENWELSNKCMESVGKEVVDWATLKVGKTVKVIAWLTDLRFVDGGLKIKDAKGAFEVLTACT